MVSVGPTLRLLDNSVSFRMLIRTVSKALTVSKRVQSMEVGASAAVLVTDWWALQFFYINIVDIFYVYSAHNNIYFYQFSFTVSVLIKLKDL